MLLLLYLNVCEELVCVCLHPHAVSVGQDCPIWEEVHTEKRYRNTPIPPTALWNGEDLTKVPLPCDDPNFQCINGVLLADKLDASLPVALMRIGLCQQK